MMKLLYGIILMLMYQVSFGQQVYKVNAGELQSISPGNGIVIRKNDRYYTLQIEVGFHGNRLKIKPVLTPIKKEDAEAFSKKENAVAYDQIDGNYDFKKLGEIQFTYTDDNPNDGNYVIHKFCRFNQHYFAIFSDKHENGNVYTNADEFLPYIYIQFGRKRILYTYRKEQLYLIPTKNRINLFELHSDYVPELKTVTAALTNREVYAFSDHAFHELKEDFFRTDTLANKTVKLKNRYNKTLIDKRFDSIVIGKIIIGYNKKAMTLYNLALKKLTQNKVKAAKIYPGSIQIIEGNNLTLTDWTGKKIETKTNYPVSHIYEPTPRDYFYEIAISKAKNDFKLKVRNLNHFGFEDANTTTDSLFLINTAGIREFYIRNKTTDTIKSSIDFTAIAIASDKKESITRYLNFNDVMVTFLREDGTSGMNYLSSFLTPENRGAFFSDTGFADYQHLQSVHYEYPYYKMKKNDLFKLYPLQKQFRYKKLDRFQGNFARFELPDKQKGWLDLNGKEYIDD